ncbi:hypothetical protein [Nannocystis radixulma]|uniref:Uncharacterized protein n=1 Tax=Nannocystis radixulma TaxID=2995305 RepID=A0ABT5B207_9BACT|nr:hypothetical protein [Nannocystis radixulma]MDC0668143.1 hypothetical protein [Nannocystis radixulma]
MTAKLTPAIARRLLATAAQLETRLAPQDWETRLHGQELAQARHWRPERVGDLVFSRWD